MRFGCAYVSTQKLSKIKSYKDGCVALQHVKVPVPEPKVDEVLIKVEAATLNPVDWKIQKGVLRPFLPRNFPTIPGMYTIMMHSYFLVLRFQLQATNNSS